MKGISAKESEENRIYNRALRRPVNERAILLEAGQGKNVNGNVFALLRSIRSDSRFDDFETFLALVPGKQAECRDKLAAYGIENVRITDFGGLEYREALATSKYLITDNSFPAYFYKRPEQVYINTWHGTPLKVLGRTNIENAVSIGNVQANMAKADWLLFPNRYTRDIMMGDYMMERCFGQRTLIMDYPRNDALYNAAFSDSLRDKLGLGGKRLIAYMPTWRGSGRDADIGDQLRKTEEIIAELDGMLREDELLFVNLHFLIDSRIDFSKYRRVRAFPREYETYDFLALCDTLITDYSSVSIDFAGTGREIILFMYDYEAYKKETGFYTDMDALPFKKAYDIAGLEKCLRSARQEYRLDECFDSPCRGSVSQRIRELLLGDCREGEGSEAENGKAPEADLSAEASASERGKEQSDMIIEDYGSRAERPDALFFENINAAESRKRLAELKSEYSGRESEAPLIIFPTVMKPETVETLKALGDRLDFIRISGRMYCSNGEFRLLRAGRRFGIFKRKAEEIYRREAMRQLGRFRLGRLTLEQGGGYDRRRMISQLGLTDSK